MDAPYDDIGGKSTGEAARELLLTEAMAYHHN
jgi:hypothetical protein